MKMSRTSDTHQAPLWKKVGIPSEHGGWSLTLEPVVLGLLIAWSWPGFALGVAALLAFITRTPLKIVMVDRWRDRWLDRTALAARIASIEAAIIIALAIVATLGAITTRFWIPIAIGIPLVALELWYDMRSRSRRLIPELAGTLGISLSVSAIVIADGGSTSLAIGMWVVISARAIAAVVYARAQVARGFGRSTALWHSDVAQALGVIAVVVAWLVNTIPLAPVIALVVIAIFNLIAVRRPISSVKAIGFQQMGFGIAVVVITAVAVLV